MRLAITNKKEIKELRDLLNEIEGLTKYEVIPDRISDWIIEEEEYFPIIHSMIKEADGHPMTFVELLFQKFSNIHHQRILWNLETLLYNCADLELSYLDFNQQIKRSAEFVEKISKIEKGSAPSVGYFEELINEAIEINNL